MADPPAPDPKAASIQWIRDYADQIGLHYDRLMDGADAWVDGHPSKWGNGQWWDGEYLVEGGTLEGTETDPEFWEHYAIVRDKPVPEKAATNFFSCSC